MSAPPPPTWPPGWARRRGTPASRTGPSRAQEVEIYLSSRSRPVVDPVRFERALHAAAVLWFLAYDVPHLAGASADRADSLTSAALAALDRLQAS